MSGSGQENIDALPELKLKPSKLKRHIVVKEMGFTFCGLETPEWYDENAPECKNCLRSYKATEAKILLSLRGDDPIQNLEDCVKALKLLNFHRLDKKTLVACIKYLTQLNNQIRDYKFPAEMIGG